ncbi:MAG TPA: hypothetical protein VH724_15710 [Candidatus Angelobacter sp.]|nr:hypothetical protein [Candidatus Angelobacter sp.]
MPRFDFGESEKVKMRLYCPACGEPFEDESELGATLKLVEHLKNIPETGHIAQLASMVKDLDRLVAQDESASQATANAEIRDAILDKCARFDERLRTLQLFAVGTLTVAVDQTREMLQECGELLGIRSRHAGESLLRNLQESLLVADRKFRP